MKDKKQIPFMRYVLFILGLCIVATFVLDDLSDFIVGFLAGWNEIDTELSRKLYGGVSIAISAVVMISYFAISRKVGNPVKRLSEGMREVAKGNLSVRVPVKGSFEFLQMEKDFNYMAEQLERETEARRVQEQKNRQLYAGIAHDLKTPMTMVMGYAKLLEQENLSDKDRQRFISTIIEQTMHTNELLDSLLMFAKLGNESYELKREENDIAECLRACVASCYPTMEDVGVSVEMSLPDMPVMFAFDELAMKRVFTNLLSNVIKHNSKGTVCLVSMEEQVYENGDRLITISVADNGPKVSASLKDILFDDFAVGDASRNTKNGSGLGLSISKKIIDRHGGELFYVDEWNSGFKAFVIELSNTAEK